MRRLLLIALCSIACNPLGRGSGQAKGKASADSWAVGDEIPGWRDYDCGAAYADAGHLSLDTLPLANITAYILQEGAGALTERNLLVTAAACEGGGCGKAPDWGSFEVPFLYFRLAEADATIGTRGQGWYGPETCCEGRTQYTYASCPMGVLVNDLGHDDNVEGVGCLSRVRPDIIEGFVSLVVDDPAYTNASPWYPTTPMLYSFSAVFPEHSAVDTARPTDGYEAPPGTEGAGYVVYDYDTAWPWDEITDPAIRDVVYERYKPWNMP